MKEDKRPIGEKFIEWQKANPEKEIKRREKIRLKHLGKKFDLTHRLNLSLKRKELIKEGKIKVPQMNKGIKYADWTKKKGICEKCNELKLIETHHKDFNHRNNEPNNLIDLCRGCHQSVHKGYAFRNNDTFVGRDENGKFTGEKRLNLKTDKTSYDRLKNGDDLRIYDK